MQQQGFSGRANRLLYRDVILLITLVNVRRTLVRFVLCEPSLGDDNDEPPAPNVVYLTVSNKLKSQINSGQKTRI